MDGNQQVKLSDIPSDFAGGTNELTEPQKAKIKMTYWVLAGAAVLLVLSGAAYIFAENGVAAFADDIRVLCFNSDLEATRDFCQKYASADLAAANTASKEIFEFCKSFIPPIVTLVLGAHYVTRSTEQNS